ncbi:hypothetical protein K2173_016209 [Erythroxylum novogranatense]|uniref:RRP12-like protein n=1 Tax=Erythroxylum novogranatense TaxID=1862640 RepID=A0AAV8SG47_9ROSI|nr:hypothetical protein K2173_016209 [Erythroxylum novogranatense]
MEGVDMERPATADDFCDWILSKFSDLSDDHQQRVCAAVGAMSQEFKDQSVPPTAVAYFAAVCSSLDRISSASADPPPHVVASLLTILSLSLPRISVAVLKKKREYVSELMVRVLRLSSTTDFAAISGLKCIAHLLIVKDIVNWIDVSQIYGVLLGFMVDSRPKVRRQSHTCIRDILQNFHGTSALGPASEGVTNTLERFLLLAGGSNVNANEGPKGAQEVLYILDALKECLPLMSSKYITSILKYYKTLLELRQPVVTRRITDSLNLICIHQTLDVSSETLLDLLCSIALSVSSNATSADNMTFTARLLDIGMRKVYTLNRQICVVKLPIIFSTLKDILASKHEEPVFAATEALKSLINNCIDERLIKQGVDQIKINMNVEGRKSGPTVIEKVCATVESLLDYHYSAVWDMVFKVVSVMFDKLGIHSSYFMRGTLTNLADMQRLPDEDFPYKKQLHECLGSALGAMGPETFLSILPLNLDADELAEVNVWLFPILKKYTVGAHLSFYTESILNEIGQMKKKSQKLELGGRIVATRSVDAIVYSLWSLLPSFCNYPSDTANDFTDLGKALCLALREECEVRGIICSALDILIQQNKRIVEEKEDPSDFEITIAKQRAMVRYTPQVATDNLNGLRECSRELLTVLSGILLESSKDEGGCLQYTINQIASIADKEVVTRIFLRTMRKLLDVTRRASYVDNSKSSNSMRIDHSSNENTISLERGRLFDLAMSLLSGLDGKEIGVLYTAVKPALQDMEGLVQKKAYKVLSTILQKSDEFLSSALEELLQLMIDVLPSCHFSAKRHRLDCLYFLIVHVSKEDSEQRRREILSSFLTEIILALKEANKKTRNRAYEILVQIGHACGDEETGGKRENLYHFFNMVAGGLAGETPHMVSAAMKGLARLAYEFSDLISTAYKLLPSTFLLLRRKNREIIKANLGLLKVLVAKSQAEGLQMHLGSLVEGLLKWQDDTKNHFKAKVKHLLEMLVGKCGLDAVKAVMPEEHMKLLTNIRKINERKEKKHGSKSEGTRSYLSRATTSRLSRWNSTKIFSDFGDEDTAASSDEYMETNSGRHSKASSQLKSNMGSLRTLSRAKRRRRSDKSLPEDLFDQLDNDPLDLLDQRKTRSALHSSEHLKRKQESDDELEIDSEGRLIIQEGGKPKKKRTSDAETDVRSETGSYRSAKSAKKLHKRQKTSDSGWAYTGKEYASKKAGGDLKRKDKLEPYAYWPLDRKMMSRRPEHQAVARKGIASVVKMTKKLEGRSASNALSMKLLKVSKGKKKGHKRKSK